MNKRERAVSSQFESHCTQIDAGRNLNYRRLALAALGLEMAAHGEGHPQRVEIIERANLEMSRLLCLSVPA